MSLTRVATMKRWRMRWTAWIASCSDDFGGTKRMVGRPTASQMASASFRSFLFDFTYGVTNWGLIRRTWWPRSVSTLAQKCAPFEASIPTKHGGRLAKNVDTACTTQKVFARRFFRERQRRERQRRISLSLNLSEPSACRVPPSSQLRSRVHLLPRGRDPYHWLIISGAPIKHAFTKSVPPYISARAECQLITNNLRWPLSST